MLHIHLKDMLHPTSRSKCNLRRWQQGTLHQSTAIWQANQQSAKVPIKTNKVITAIRLDGNIFIDGNEADNQWEASKK
jgi:hypothetical protein